MPQRQYVYEENIFDITIKKLPDLWGVVKNNLALISIIITIIGGLSQVIKLFSISPVLINYYSPTQGVLDGILFLIFIFIYFYFSLSMIMVSRKMRRHRSKIVKFIFSISLIVISGFLMIYIFSRWQSLVGLIFFIPVGSSASSVFTTEEELKADDEKPKNLFEKKNKEKKERNETFYFLSIVFIILLVSFSNIQSIVKKEFTGDIVNYELLEEKVNLNVNPHDYKKIHSNFDYVIFESKTTNKYFIIKQEKELKAFTK